MPNQTQVIGISNAIVDILSQVNHKFLQEIDVTPGSMNLINETDAANLYNQMTQTKEMSGGSVANTIACFSSFGGNAGYIGQVKNDRWGRIFVDDMVSMGVDVRLPPAETGAATARSHVLITDDGQRTMQTFLGACTELSVIDVNEESIGSTQIILLEGYIWDIPDGEKIAKEAIKLKANSSVKIALSLSDSFCVERHHQAFSEITRHDVDIIFANENEMMMLTQTKNYEDMISEASKLNNLSVITLGAKGSVIVNGSIITNEDAVTTQNIVDTTGAGDTYTAAFLYGLTQDKTIPECAHLGSWSASKVIQQIGARLDKDIIGKYELR